MGFLPPELSEEELTEIVQQTIAETGATSPREMGQVMKAVLPKIAGRAEGARVSAIVKRILQG
jgi:uncharacterized protein YqeY